MNLLAVDNRGILDGRTSPSWISRPLQFTFAQAYRNLAMNFSPHAWDYDFPRQRIKNLESRTQSPAISPVAARFCGRVPPTVHNVVHKPGGRVSERTDRPSLVSVAELPGSYEEPASPDRTPPQDIAAEQSVLGAMMLSKDAIADVVELIRENDFYRPAHATIYSAVLDLYGKGEPADAVTVSHELTRTGELARIGGAPYLHTLVSMVPTAANAEFYARIVRERAILRRLVEAGTRIVQMGYTGEGEVDDVVDRAQAEVYEVTERRTAEDYLPLRDLMDGALTEIEAISNRGGQMVGVPTGFADLD